MIAETATVCATAIALYGMRLYVSRLDASTADKAFEVARTAAACTNEVAQVRHAHDLITGRLDALTARIETVDGRVSALHMKR